MLDVAYLLFTINHRQTKQGSMELRFDVIDLPYVGLPNLPSGRKGLGPINRNMSRSLPLTTQAISYWDSPQVLESMGSLQLVPQTQTIGQGSIRL